MRCNIASCPCNIINVIVGGGINVGGFANQTDNIVSGGLGCTGSALVDMPQYLYDGMEFVFPLDETESPYLDRVLSLVGTSFDNTLGLIRTDGVGCLYSQKFVIDEETQIGSAISLENDSLISKNYSFSFWIRPQDENFRQGIIYKRGEAVIVSYSILRHIQVSVNVGDDVFIDCFSSPIAYDNWCHVAVNIDSEITIFVNGVLSGSEPIVGTPVESTIDGSFGSVGGYPVCQLQEFRLYPEVHDSNFWSAEKLTMCGSFVDYGEVVEI